MPSSSARCSQLPRAVDKLPFYIAMRKLRDHLRGDLPHLDDTDVTFPDLELKVEPKKERLDAEVKEEMAHSATSATNQQTSSGTFQLTFEIKTEDNDSGSGKRKRGRRKRSSSTAGSDGKEPPTSATVSVLPGEVSSPYFLPWQQPSVHATRSVRTGHRCSAEPVDVTHQVKTETPFDFTHYGNMPADLTTARTGSNMLPLPDMKPGFCWRPTNL